MKRCTRAIVCQTLLGQKADVNIPGPAGECPLHVAARWGDPAVCRELVVAKADVNAQAAGNSTPLHLACDASRKVEVEVETEDGETVTEWVPSHHDCCLQLLQLGAIPHASTEEDQWTPLLFAARRGDTDLCDVMMKMKSTNKGSAISQTTRDGWGMLHLAVLAGNSQLVHLAIRLGVDEKATAMVCEIREGLRASKIVTKKSPMTAEALAVSPRVRKIFCRGLTAFGSDVTEAAALKNLDAVIKTLQEGVNPQDARAKQDAQIERMAEKLAAGGMLSL